jgi:hypothetical protein
MCTGLANLPKHILLKYGASTTVYTTNLIIFIFDIYFIFAPTVIFLSVPFFRMRHSHDTSCVNMVNMSLPCV